MPSPLVTVAISFFNNEDTLRDAIVSVLNQSFSDWELILIDDGSNDRSLEVVKKYSDPRIILISDGHNKGFVARLNQSVFLARGKYYARMDADDVMHPDRLKEQVQFLETRSDVDVVDTGMYVMNQEGKLTGIRDSSVKQRTLASILLGRTLNHATTVGKLSWFKKNAYDPDYVRAEDVELWCRTISHSVFARYSRPLYFVREGKINVKNYMKSQQTLRKIIKKYGPQILDKTTRYHLIFLTYFKALIYRVMGCLELQAFLTKLRNNKINPELREQIEQELSRALQGT